MAQSWSPATRPSLAVAPFELVVDQLRNDTKDLHPCFAVAVLAAHESAWKAVSTLERDELGRTVLLGADGTPSSRLDVDVESAILNALEPFNINVLSEECGFIDNGSSLTFVMDPVDGTSNAIAGVPAAGFAGALADDSVFIEAVMTSLTTGACWAGRTGTPTPYRTSGRKELTGAAVSLLRPKRGLGAQWWSIAQRAERIRILSTTIVEAGLVAQGSTDAFADAGSDTHRLVDLAAPAVLLPLAGGVVIDLHDRPIALATDLTLRWSGIIAASEELASSIAEAVLRSESISQNADEPLFA
jgi:myo-inositol-1(or 4)-monophosphatase